MTEQQDKTQRRQPSCVGSGSVKAFSFELVSALRMLSTRVCCIFG